VLAILDKAMDAAKAEAKMSETIMILDAEYTGEVVDGEANGYGRSTELGHSVYEGTFKDNEKHGVGTITYEYEQMKYFYAGEWKEDAQHGMGLFTWSDGGRYCGGFQFGNNK
jgi:hypothetical protein